MAEIRDQLAYREANRQEVRNFHVTRTMGGGYTRLLLDEEAGKFLVSSSPDLVETNPDVLRFSQLTGCEIEIRERRDEEKQTVKDAQGHSHTVSYDPPRINYEYDFFVEIRVDAPFFDSLRFQVNGSTPVLRPWEGGLVSLSGVTRSMKLRDEEYMHWDAMAREIKAVLDRARIEARSVQPGPTEDV